DGNTSTTEAPTTSDGPAFETTTAYVTAVPGTSSAKPSVLVTDRSAVGVNESTSVAELFDKSGSVTTPGDDTDAELTNEPDALAATTADTVYVTDEPTSRFTESI